MFPNNYGHIIAMMLPRLYHNVRICLINNSDLCCQIDELFLGERNQELGSEK